MKRLILFFILLSSAAFSQDATFTNNQQSLVYTNPSFAGRNGLIRSQSSYRIQRSSGFATAISSIDGFIKPLNAGIAVTAFSDDMGNGKLKSSSISVSYAQYIRLKNRGRIIPSFQFGMGNLNLDRSMLNFGDVINPRNGEIWNTKNAVPMAQKSYVNMGAGLLYSRGGNYTGVYFSNINQPDIGLSHNLKLPMRTSVYLSGNLLDDFYLINISLMGNFQPGSFNVQLKYTETISKYIVFAVGYAGAKKNSDYGQGAVASCGLRYKIFTLMYGYSQLYVVNSDYRPLGASHDISLSISFRKKDDSLIARHFSHDLEGW